MCKSHTKTSCWLETEQQDDTGTEKPMNLEAEIYSDEEEGTQLEEYLSVCIARAIEIVTMFVCFVLCVAG